MLWFFNVYRRAFSCPKTILIICQNSHLFPFITNKYANQAQAKVSIIWSLQKRFWKIKFQTIKDCFGYFFLYVGFYFHKKEIAGWVFDNFWPWLIPCFRSYIISNRWFRVGQCIKIDNGSSTRLNLNISNCSIFTFPKFSQI